MGRRSVEPAADRRLGNTEIEAKPTECPSEQSFFETTPDSSETLIVRGKERGYLTYEEVNAALPTHQMSAEQIEDTMMALSELGIDIVENDDADETADL